MRCLIMGSDARRLPKATTKLLLCISLLLPMQLQANTSSSEPSAQQIAQKIVIAHRGASGYLPEHSMASKKLAFEMGADYIEQDIVLSKDNKLLVLHDLYLDRVTDVAQIFAGRARADGRYYAIDFTYDEIKTLRLTERFVIENNQQIAKYPERSKLWQGDYQVHLLKDELALIAALNTASNKNVGIYPEIKAPSFHRNEGKDISLLVLQEIKRFGYDQQDDKVYLQSFDANELQRIDSQLLPKLEMDLKLVQLIANTFWGITKIYTANGSEKYNYDWMFQAGAMPKIAQYAEGIGPHKRMLISKASAKNKLVITPMLESAHRAGLVVHPYTFRLDAGRVEGYADSFEDMLDIFYFTLGVDGVFTDFPDRVVEFLRLKKDKGS